MKQIVIFLRALVLGLSWVSLSVLAVPNADGESAQTQQYIQQSLQAIFNAPSGGTQRHFLLPEGWIRDRYQLSDLSVEKFSRAQPARQRVAIQFHGGAYVYGLDQGYRYFAITQAEALGADSIYVFDYALAPQHLYPKALEQALLVYRSVLDEGVAPEQLIFIGDSAGGNLALATAVASKQLKLPQPRALVLQSPWVTLDDVPTHHEHAELDLMLGTKGTPLFAEIVKPTFAQGYRLDDPLISPAYADLSGLPAMLIQAGSYETLLSDSEILASRATKAGVPCQLTIYKGMPHDFQIMLPDLPQTKQAFTEISLFIDRLYR